MPHIHLETTADLPENANIPDILEALTRVLASQETVKSASIKAYHSLRVNWYVGEGHRAGFAHATVSILAGRPVELRQTMARALYEEMRTQFAESLNEKEAAVTLEVREMDPATYQH